VPERHRSMPPRPDGDESRGGSTSAYPLRTGGDSLSIAAAPQIRRRPSGFGSPASDRAFGRSRT
jgi:hypothetical protein